MRKLFILSLILISFTLFSCSTIKKEATPSSSITIIEPEKREDKSIDDVEKEKDEKKEEIEKEVVVDNIVTLDKSTPHEEEIPINISNEKEEIINDEDNQKIDDTKETIEETKTEIKLRELSNLLDAFNYAYGYSNMEKIKEEGISVISSYFTLGLYDATINRYEPRFLSLDAISSTINEYVESYYYNGISFDKGERVTTLESLLEIAPPTDLIELFSYAYGFSIVSDLLEGEVDILFIPFASGMLDSLYSSTPLLDNTQIENAIDAYIIYLNEEYYKEIEETKEKNEEKAKEFLKENLNNGVEEIEEGVQILLLDEDDTIGNKPTQYDTIVADYNEYYYDYDEEDLVIVDAVYMEELSVITLPRGLQKAITNMHTGQAIRAFIAPELSGMEDGDDTIPPYSVIVYDIALHSIL